MQRIGKEIRYALVIVPMQVKNAVGSEFRLCLSNL